LIGYRWFDAQKIDPLFPFGFGLSYTRFTYSKPEVRSLPDGGAEVSVRVRNSGRVGGDEVPQAYLDAPVKPIDGVQFAPRTLAAFDRVTLQPGESREVRLRIAPRAFQYWSARERAWRTPPGPRTLHVGTSSRDLRMAVTIVPRQPSPLQQAP
jgi:beta-glucosidase